MLVIPPSGRGNCTPARLAIVTIRGILQIPKVLDIQGCQRSLQPRGKCYGQLGEGKQEKGGSYLVTMNVTKY